MVINLHGIMAFWNEQTVKKGDGPYNCWSDFVDETNGSVPIPRQSSLQSDFDGDNRRHRHGCIGDKINGFRSTYSNLSNLNLPSAPFGIPQTSNASIAPYELFREKENLPFYGNLPFRDIFNSYRKMDDAMFNNENGDDEQLIRTTMQHFQNLNISSVQETRENDVRENDVRENDVRLPQKSDEYNTSQTFMPNKKVLTPANKETICVFCKNNNEPEYVYRGHATKDKKNRVLCPRLRAYKCKICGASGDNAHTLKYCPIRPPNKDLLSLVNMHGYHPQ